MFWSSNEYLNLCQELSELGFNPELSSGGRVARGFADLGFEEYLYLPPNNLVSLFTGDKSILPDEHRHFFFAVPSVDEMVNFAIAKGAKIKQLDFENQRTWTLNVEFSSQNYLFQDDDINLTIGKFLLTILKQ
ncbi:MAG: hypothetical protein KDD56_04615 [Bdellovibrionales bacterium]|nr:hypothetical protein [Bdellovibrionales bacterium]